MKKKSLPNKAKIDNPTVSNVNKNVCLPYIFFIILIENRFNKYPFWHF